MSDKFMSDKYIIFTVCGRLGNAIFRYMAGVVLNISNPSLNYILEKDYTSKPNPYTFYHGLDHIGDDLYKSSGDTNFEAMSIPANNNSAIVGFNTLGYFKHNIDITNLKRNEYINNTTKHGVYVKNKLRITDDNYFNFLKKNLSAFDVELSGYFQFDYIYLKYKSKILQFMEQHKNLHQIQSSGNNSHPILMRDILDDIKLNKTYDVVIHIRLNDFNGRPDFIETEYYLALFETLDFTNKTICLITDKVDANHAFAEKDTLYLLQISGWFNSRNIPITIESNELMVDFNLMKQTKTLICSMSTLSWMAAYFSKMLEQCYMPDYNFYNIADRKPFFFRKPIENTILYPVKTTCSVLSSIKPFIITLPQYEQRLVQLNDLRKNFIQVGLNITLETGVYGKDIIITDTDTDTSKSHIKQLKWNDKTFLYDSTERIKEQIVDWAQININNIDIDYYIDKTHINQNHIDNHHMSVGEFGCAMSHLNLLDKLVKEPSNIKYYLIMEDDVELVKPLDELYQLFQHLPPDLDLCHLAKSEWHNFIKSKQVNKYFYECVKEYFNKTTAYIVSKKGAEKILAYAKGMINIPIDNLFSTMFVYTNNFLFYVPESYFFKEQDNVESSIKSIDSSLVTSGTG